MKRRISAQSTGSAIDYFPVHSLPMKTPFFLAVVQKEEGLAIIVSYLLQQERW
ncbi:hypothetical protein [Methanocalculus sp. MC3]